jgi:hypothetical protein
VSIVDKQRFDARAVTLLGVLAQLPLSASSHADRPTFFINGRRQDGPADLATLTADSSEARASLLTVNSDLWRASDVKPTAPAPRCGMATHDVCRATSVHRRGRLPHADGRTSSQANWTDWSNLSMLE